MKTPIRLDRKTWRKHRFNKSLFLSQTTSLQLTHFQLQITPSTQTCYYIQRLLTLSNKFVGDLYTPVTTKFLLHNLEHTQTLLWKKILWQSYSSHLNFSLCLNYSFLQFFSEGNFHLGVSSRPSRRSVNTLRDRTRYLGALYLRTHRKL